MTSQPSEKPSPTIAKSQRAGAFDWLFVISGMTAISLILSGEPFSIEWGGRSLDPAWDTSPIPLVMQGGNPYIRALMRTISASESNGAQPYSLLYGGEHIQNLDRHPDRCVPILAGPNVGDCTTAAGRYQFITTTWIEKARHYHPYPINVLFWESYSFKPEYQDEVVYRWLSDPQAWGVNLSTLLQQGEVSEVLRILSSTWTSLGYGIESNSMTDALPSIYEQMLKEELANANS